MLGDNEIVEEYERLREKFKGDKQLYLESFKNVSAKVEVKLKCRHEEFKKKMEEIEIESLKQNNSLSVLPCKNNSQNYEIIKNKLCIMKCLRNQFSF